MTLDQFQAEKSLKEEAAKSGIVHTLISVLESESVTNHGRSGRACGAGASPVAPDEKILALGHVQGFNEAIRTLRMCVAEPRPVMKDIKSTYAPVNPPVQTVVQRKPREKT